MNPLDEAEVDRRVAGHELANLLQGPQPFDVESQDHPPMIPNPPSGSSLMGQGCPAVAVAPAATPCGMANAESLSDALNGLTDDLTDAMRALADAPQGREKQTIPDELLEANMAIREHLAPAVERLANAVALNAYESACRRGSVAAAGDYSGMFGLGFRREDVKAHAATER